MKSEIVNEGTLFTIDLQALNQASGKPTGSLEGLQLSIPDNQLQILPRGLSPAIKTGIPLEIWSETRVQGDNQGNFNVESTDRSTMWVPVENNRPSTPSHHSKTGRGFFTADNFD